MIDKTLEQDEIRAAVRERYGRLAAREAPGCCSPEDSCAPPRARMEGKLVQMAGYSDEELAVLPGGALAASFGCGNPLAFSDVHEGQTVLDIGSGAGIDCFIAARRVGRSGHVIGIDMTREMLERAGENARAGGYDNVEFRMGEAEDIPAADGSVDWVISNCVINLSPDKPRVFAEIARVLKPGGRFSISDIVASESLPEDIRSSLSAWTGCVAGAISEAEYLEGLRRAGLRDVEVAERVVYDEPTIRSFVDSCSLPLDDAGVRKIVAEIGGKVWSARIQGRR